MTPRPDNISLVAENQLVTFINEAQVKVKFTLGVRYEYSSILSWSQLEMGWWVKTKPWERDTLAILQDVGRASR
jgi:hypothetical protein